MGEVSSDTPEKIGERLADAMVEQVSDLGGTPEEFRHGLAEVTRIIKARFDAEYRGSAVDELHEKATGTHEDHAG